MISEGMQSSFVMPGGDVVKYLDVSSEWMIAFVIRQRIAKNHRSTANGHVR
jgi:hypothetical protein